MAADLRLIPDAAKADPDIFSSESPRDALADAGLTRTRRSHKEQDGTGLFLIQSHDSQLLDDTLLYLGKAVMILVQDFLGLLQINRGGGFRLPGKGGDKLQIIVEHAVLMAVLAFLFHAVQDFVRLFARLLSHAGGLYFLLKPAHIGDIFRMHIVKLLLQKLNLFFQGCLAVKALVVFLLGIFCLHAHAVDLDGLPDGFFDELAAFLSGIGPDDPVFILPGDMNVTGDRTEGLFQILPVQHIVSRQHAPLELADII